MTNLEILKAARELLSDPKRWTQYRLARDENGNEAEVENGCSFCMLGAIAKVSNVDPYTNYNTVCDVLYDVMPMGLGIGEFNDRSTHAEVLAIMDKAIAKLEAR